MTLRSLVPTVLRGNAVFDALRRLCTGKMRTQSVQDGIPTRSEGTSSPARDVKPIELTPLDRALIDQRIAEFLADTTSAHAYAHKSVARENMLPLCLAGWSGFEALTRDGRVVHVEDDGAITVEKGERERNIALFEGSQRYPEIQALVVTRPPDAIDCKYCGGTGRINEPDLAHIKNLACYCGGLGWVPHDDF